MGKILIIEDEEMLAMLEKDYLEMSNFQVTVETSGDTGLEKALNGSYDLVILDIGLPVIDGFEICKKIREQKNIPIMIVSAKKDEIDIVRGLGLGADDYVVKPFSPNELVARAKAHIAFYERLAGKRDENSIIETRGNNRFAVTDVALPHNIYQETEASRGSGTFPDIL